MGMDIKIKKKTFLKKLVMLTTSIVPVVIIASGSSTSSSPIASGDQQIVDQLKTKFINKATKLVDADTKYPSALEDNAWTNFEINDLGYELPVIPNGVAVTYEITPDNESGKFTVTAKINKNVATATKTFEVTGFKVASGEKLQALNLIKTFISKDSTLTNKKTLLPSSILGDTRFTMGTNTYYPNKVSLPNSNPYGFKESTISVPNNMIVEYKISPNDTGGSFIFEVQVYKVKTYEDCGWFICNTVFNGTETLAKGRFKLTGFKTQLEHDQEFLNAIKITKDMLEYKESKAVLPSTITKPKKLIDKNGMSLEYTKWSQNDENGTIDWKITLKKGDAKREISSQITGFKTNLDIVKETIKTLGNDALNALRDANALPSSVTLKSKVLSEIKKITTIATLSKEQRDLIVEDFISLNYDNENGEILVVISKDEFSKTITITGFQTTIQANALAMKNFVANLQELDFNPLISSSTKASSISSADVFNKVKSLIKFNNLDESVKKLLKEADIKSLGDDIKGELTIRIINHSTKNDIKLLGFKKHSDKNKKDVKDFISRLDHTFLNQLADGTKWVNQVTKDNVLSAIKATRGYRDLTPEQQKIITANIFVISQDVEGELKVSFSYDGLSKEIKKSGFKTNAKVVEEAIQAITKAMLRSLTLKKAPNTKRLPSQVTIKRVKDVILFHWNKPSSSLNEAQKNLLQDSDIKILPNNDNGTLKITISNHGNDKVLIIPDFKTTKQENQEILSRITKRGSSFFLTFTNKNLLPSEVPRPSNGVITSSGVTYTYETWNADDDLGRISYKIKWTKGSSEISYRVIEINFQTKAYRTKIEKIASAIKSLGDDSFNNLNDVNKLPSEIAKTSVFDQWKLVSTSLSTNEKMLLTTNMLALTPNDPLGTLLIVISAFGAQKDITLTQFLTTSKKQAIADVQSTIAIDLNLLVADTNSLPSKVAKPSDGVTSKGVAYTYEAWNPNDVEGKIDYAVSLSKESFTKKLLGQITNFKTNAKLVAERLASLENNIFDEFKDKAVLASTVTSKTQFLNKIKTRPTIQNLSQAQRDLIDEKIISLNYDDALGKLTITINIQPTAKVIEIRGFKTNAQLVAKLIEKIIQSLASDSFTGLTQNGQKFPSEFQSSDVSTYLKRAGNALGNLNPDQKDLLKTNQITLSFNDDNGVLTIIVKGHGAQKVVNVAGFKSNLGIIAKIIQNLNATTFEILTNRGQRFASEVKASEIAAHLKKDGQALNSLTDSQKALFTTSAINLDSNDDSGVLAITINVNGQDKVLKVANFKNNFQVTLDKVASAILSLDDNSLDILSNGEVLASYVSANYVAMELKKLLTSLDAFQKLLISSSDISLDANDDTGSLKVTVSIDNKSKQFIVSGFLTTAKKNDRNDIEAVRTTDLNLPASSKVLPTTISQPEDAGTASGVSYAYTTWNQNDDLGEIRWTVSLNKGFGEEKSLEGVISGFKTNSVVIIEEFIKNLDDTTFSGLSNFNKLANQITKVDVLSFLLRVADTKKITNEQQKLLNTKNIVLAPNNKKGELELTIKNYGKTKKFKIGDFKVKKALKTQKQITKPKPKESSSESLSILAIVGIFGGATVGAILIGLVLFFYYRKYKKLRKGK